MPDFGSRWLLAEKKPLGKGGQGHAYLVSDGPGGPQYVAKVLIGASLTDQSPRWKRMEEEVEVCKSFNHPNVVRLIDSGHTQNSLYPYFVMPLYAGGSLQDRGAPFGSPPVEILNFFAGICDGLAYVHSQNIIHRDIKPANIFLDAASLPVVGDFGLCFRFNAESLTERMEVATARWFGAPELRDGHLENPQPSADIYSLGKLLYWLFTGRVYDRDEQEYDRADRKLPRVLAQSDFDTEANHDQRMHAGAFADEIVSQTVRYQSADRIQRADELAAKVRKTIARVLSGGHALDFGLPQRCLFCGVGRYKPLAELPPIDLRLAPPDPTRLPSQWPDIYKNMRDRATTSFGPHSSGAGGVGAVGPLFLICQYCGNVQEFRFDLAPEAIKNWKP
jgi:serine/threonine protein kinase